MFWSVLGIGLISLANFNTDRVIVRKDLVEKHMKSSHKFYRAELEMNNLDSTKEIVDKNCSFTPYLSNWYADKYIGYVIRLEIASHLQYLLNRNIFGDETQIQHMLDVEDLWDIFEDFQLFIILVLMIYGYYRYYTNNIAAPQ